MKTEQEIRRALYQLESNLEYYRLHKPYWEYEKEIEETLQKIYSLKWVLDEIEE